LLVLGVVVIASALTGLVVLLNILEARLPARAPSTSANAGPVADGAPGATGLATPASQDAWVAFTGQCVSLELPAWFVGGRPDDASARAALEQLLGMGLEEWFSAYAQTPLEQGEVELLMAGAIGTAGELMVVAAEGDDLLPGTSLGAYVEELGAWFVGEGLSVDLITEDRALCRFGSWRSDDSSRAMVSRVALVRFGARVHVVNYTAAAEWSGALNSIFGPSAGTIVVRQ
jgi:hypothetical protein